MRALPQRFLRAAGGGARLFHRRNGMVYSAAIAFNLLLSAVPVLFLVFWATSLLIGRDELPFRQLSAFLHRTVPYGAPVLVPTLRQLFASGATFGIVGGLLLLVSSFSATAAVHTSLAVMMGRPRSRQLLRGAAFHVVLVLALIVAASAAILVPPVWKGLSFLPVRIPRGWQTVLGTAAGIAADAVLAGVVFGGSALSYRYLAPQPVRSGNAIAGAAAFCAILLALNLAVSFYIRKISSLSVIYGSMFRIVSFIIVIYLFAAAYLVCASFIGMLESDGGDGAAVPGEGRGAGEHRAAGGG